MTAVMKRFQALRDKYGCSVIILHHKSLSEKSQGRGSSAIPSLADYHYVIETKIGVDTVDGDAISVIESMRFEIGVKGRCGIRPVLDLNYAHKPGSDWKREFTEQFRAKPSKDPKADHAADRYEPWRASLEELFKDPSASKSRRSFYAATKAKAGIGLTKRQIEEWYDVRIGKGIRTIPPDYTM